MLSHARSSHTHSVKPCIQLSLPPTPVVCPLIPHTSGLPSHYPPHSVKPCMQLSYPHTSGLPSHTPTQCYPPHTHNVTPHTVLSYPNTMLPPTRCSHTPTHTMLPHTQYRRRDSDRSQYRSYLDYVREIGENMGFKVQEDTMRIPSSKRVSDEL